MEVTYSGSASVHHSSETKASSARQFCFSGSAKMGTAAAAVAWHAQQQWTQKY